MDYIQSKNWHCPLVARKKYYIWQLKRCSDGFLFLVGQMFMSWCLVRNGGWLLCSIPTGIKELHEPFLQEEMVMHLAKWFELMNGSLVDDFPSTGHSPHSCLYVIHLLRFSSQGQTGFHSAGPPTTPDRAIPGGPLVGVHSPGVWTVFEAPMTEAQLFGMYFFNRNKNALIFFSL